METDTINFSLMTFSEITLLLLLQGILTVREVITKRTEYDQYIVKTINNN